MLPAIVTENDNLVFSVPTAADVEVRIGGKTVLQLGALEARLASLNASFIQLKDSTGDSSSTNYVELSTAVQVLGDEMSTLHATIGDEISTQASSVRADLSSQIATLASGPVQDNSNRAAALESNFAAAGIVTQLSAQASAAEANLQRLGQNVPSSMDTFAEVSTALSSQSARIDGVNTVVNTVSGQVSSAATQAQVTEIHTMLTNMSNCAKSGRIFDYSTRTCISGCLVSNWFLDADGDGYGNATAVQLSCSSPSPSYVTNNLDCNDADAAVNPAAAEKLNGIDDNCDGRAFGNDMIYTSNVALAGGTYEVANFSLASGATLTISDAIPLTIFALNKLIVAGTIDIRGGPGQTWQASGTGGVGGGGGGGRGGTGSQGGDGAAGMLGCIADLL